MDPAFRRPSFHTMKTKNLSVVLCPLLAFAFALPLSAQNSRRVVLPPPQPAGQPVQPGQPYQQESAAELPHNVKLTLDGMLFGTIPTDFSVTTGGTTVSSDMSLGGDGPAPVIGSFQAVLTPGEPWQVRISIGARTPLKNGDNIEYRDFTLSTTVRIAPGKKVVLWQKGEQKLTLSMEKVEE
jgi:hypothetical protein